MAVLENQNVQTLTKLGLTLLQAKVYLASLSAGKQKLEVITEIADIDRANGHRVIMHLEKIGLVAKILGAPNQYQAIPLKEAISILLSAKKEQYEEMQRDAKKLIIRAQNSATKPEGFEIQIRKRSKEMELRKVMLSCKNMRLGFDGLLTKKTFFLSFIDLADIQLECVKRGMKYRLVTEKIDKELIRDKLMKFLSFKNFQIKYVLETPLSEMAIMDKENATIILSMKSALGEKGRTYLTTNHPGCIEIYQEYFEKVWLEAREYECMKNVLV